MAKEKKIALVLKTNGLEYDDRVRKEITTIQSLFPEVKFKIFVMLDDLNKETEGITQYGVPYRTVYVPAREKYSSGSKAFLKAWQFYKAVKKDIKSYDAIWAANIDSICIVLFAKSKRIIWDLHELPYRLFYSRLKRMILRMAFRRCKLVVHANLQRIKYMESIGLIPDINKHFSLRNYPNFDDIDTEYDQAYYSFVEWKKERRCVYLQGLTDDSRAAYESVRAVLDTPELCAVVVGKFDKDAKERLEKECKDSFMNRVFFVGQISQLKIPQYVKLCSMSLIFYKNVRPNNWFCEANRFYQSVIMGLPVVVGANPSMRELIEKYNFGIAINDDGSNIDAIKDGIKKLDELYDTILEYNRKNKNELLWKNQDEQIKLIVNHLFE